MCANWSSRRGPRLQDRARGCTLRRVGRHGSELSTKIHTLRWIRDGDRPAPSTTTGCRADGSEVRDVLGPTSSQRSRCSRVRAERRPSRRRYHACRGTCAGGLERYRFSIGHSNDVYASSKVRAQGACAASTVRLHATLKQRRISRRELAKLQCQLGQLHAYAAVTPTIGGYHASPPMWPGTAEATLPRRRMLSEWPACR